MNSDECLRQCDGQLPSATSQIKAVSRSHTRLIQNRRGDRFAIGRRA